ncbi:C39 family peptidase [Levilactobacillus fuyuanensis]|uniref:C39 family peptidase n=1 Tax=Levilactobacillus fuyuanensis TaxID=2486022 RepID=A0ABW4H2S1_9LACO|nr:C39 family peptidase [Levilactobacillus fuyuanensis]
MNRLIAGLAVAGLGFFLGAVPSGVVHAATATSTASSTTTKTSTATAGEEATSSASVSSSSSSTESTPKPKPKPQVTYRKVISQKKVNYYTKIGTNRKHNYKVYQTGGAKSSARNVKAISTGRHYATKKVHITREEKMGDGTWLKFTYKHTQTGWIHRNGTVKSYRWLNVPLIAQRPELPTGCEITATTMMLQYAGAKVTKKSLAKEMPRSSNPNKGFVGSPYSKTGWWIYPKGLVKTVRHHLGSATDMTGASFNMMKAKINHGHPVVIWVAGVDGFVNHAVTLSGYSSTRAYYNDPWTKRKTSMSLASLHNHRKHDAYRALSY